MRICSDSAVKMYWMSICPVPVSLLLTLSKYVMLKQRFFVPNLLFHASIDFKFYDFDTCQYAIFCHSRENFVFDNR